MNRKKIVYCHITCFFIAFDLLEGGDICVICGRSSTYNYDLIIHLPIIYFVLGFGMHGCAMIDVFTCEASICLLVGTKPELPSVHCVTCVSWLKTIALLFMPYWRVA